MTYSKALLSYRKKIDALDRKILETLSKRLKTVQALGKVKAKKNIPVRDLQREAELEKLRSKCAKEFKLDPQLVEKIFRFIGVASRKIQRRKKRSSMIQ